MVTYNPRDWIKLIVHFRKSDTLRILFPAILLLGVITASVAFAGKHYLNSSYIPVNLTIFHQISGFIISLVLVFRINSAYDRWWEGRKLWGALINHSRNLSIQLNAMLPEQERELRKELQSLISNFSMSLKEHLRGKTGDELMEYSKYFKKEDYLNATHKPNFIASILTQRILTVLKEKNLPDTYFLALSQNLNEMIDVCGACERIKNTPIPYSYSIFIKKIIFIYIMTMPFTFGLTLSYWAILVVMVMFYAFASLELISEEIEDPFGTDDNDLPTDEIAEKIRLNSTEILLT